MRLVGSVARRLGLEGPPSSRLGITLVALAVLCALVLAGTAVAAPDFQLTISPSSQTLQPGSSVSFALGVGSIDGFAGPVALSVSGLPSGVSAEFSPNPVTPPNTSFLKLTAASDAALGTFSLTITATGGGITHVASGSATVDFGLVPVCEGKIHGVVTDAETGLPVAGATVSPFTTTTDVTGSYTVDHVRLGENNSPVEVELTAQKDEPLFAHIGQYWHATKSGVAVCNQTTEIDLALVPVHPGFLSGTIVEGNPDPSDYSKVIPTSTPIEGARPVLGYLAPEEPFTTGQDGRYDLSFHVGYNNEPITPILAVEVPDLPYRHGYWAREIVLGEIGPDQHVVQDVALVKQCTASISGHVSYGDTGLPAANVQVSSGNAANTDEDSTQTDAQGAFSFPELLIGMNNRPVAFDAFADAPGYNEAFVDSRTDSLAFGCDGHWNVTLVLQRSATPNFGTVEGHAYDQETGAPIADAAIQIVTGGQCAIPGSKCVATTDSQGFYRLDPVPVSFDSSITTVQYGIDAFHEAPFTPTPDYYADAGTVDVTAGSTAVHDFHLLRRHYGRLTGVVRDAITHAPIAGAGGLNCGLADDNGRYDTGQRPLDYPNAPTDISCTFVANGYWDQATTATIRADETTQQDVDLLPICQGATISGKVVDAITQNPIEGATVGGGVASATTDANGDYRLDNVTVGYGNSPLDVQVTASAPGYYTQTKTVTVFCGGAIVLDFGRQATAFGAVEGYVTNNVSGHPIANVFIGSEFGAGATTDASGYYKLSNVPLNPDGSDRTWHVTAMPDGFDPQTKSVTVHANTTSRLDFNFGNLEPPGHIVVKKVTKPAGDSSTFSFTGDVVGTIGDGQTISVDVAPGSYHSTEQVPAGWMLESISCDDPDSSVDKTAATATFQVAAGETVTCTFTDAKRGTIVVKKAARPVGDAATFAFTGAAAGSIGDGQTITVPSLAPGTYSSTEVVPMGWDLGSIGCDDDQSAGPSSGDRGSATATFHLDPGETVTCIFTDYKRGTIVLKKQTQPIGAGGSFGFTGDAAGSIGDGGTITVPNLSTVGAPTYTSTEADPTPNFDLTTISCDDAASAHPSSGDLASRTASFRLDPGETATCTLTNTKRGAVSVRKTVSGLPPGGSQSFDFQLRQNASASSDGSILATCTANASNGGVCSFSGKYAPATYQFCELVMPGWKTSMTGTFVPNSLNNPLVDNSSVCVNFTLAAGEPKLFTIDNTPPPGGLARTIGFWKNWGSCSASNGKQRPVLDQTLAAAGSIAIGNLAVKDCKTAVAILNKSEAKTGTKMASDPAYGLAAQLLAAKLNVVAQAITCSLEATAVSDAQSLLVAVNFTGTGPYTKSMTTAQRNQATALAGTLDRYNNNLLC
jgi:hypothetical protein